MVPEEVMITLCEVPGLGPRKVRAILNTFSEVADWDDLLDQDLSRVEGVSATLINRLRKTNPDTGRRILNRIRRLNTRYIHYWHPEYPLLLKGVYDAPVALYVRGSGSLEGDFLAVVGTRKPSSYGKDQTRRLTRDLVGAGLGITSGFARGIDTISHRTALESGGRTVAVLGNGVDVVYPAENRNIYQTLLENGLAISEYPPGTKPDGHNFPRRNRIIAGLSVGTLVVEGGRGSGALITAYYANDQDREVFAVPGPVDSPRSAGCHRLIQDGAKLVAGAEDILAELSPQWAPQPGNQLDLLRDDLSDGELKMLEFLGTEPLLVDTIAEELSKDVSEVLAVLLTLEVKALVVQTAGKRFARA